MSEIEYSFSQEKHLPQSTWLPATILDSLKIILGNKSIFFSFFALFTLPLSVMFFALSFSSIPLHDHIYHLEAIANMVHTRVEASQVLQESRQDAVSLLHMKSRFFIPSFLLSLLSTITIVISTSLSYHGRNPSFNSVFNSIKYTWKRVVATSIVIYGIFLLYAMVPFFLSVVLRSEPGIRFLVMAISFGFVIYLMAVMGLGIVVSVLEDRYGWDAICVGSMLMKGKRISGFMLSGMLVMLSSAVGQTMEKLMKGRHSSTSSSWMAVIGGWDSVGLVCLYGFEILWGYAVTTVFYCECKKRHVRDEDGSLADV